MAVEAVVGVRRFHVAALGGNQQAALAQQGEQGIAPAGHALHPQQRGDFTPQLARAQPGQFSAHGPHVFQHGRVALALPGLALAALVKA